MTSSVATPLSPQTRAAAIEALAGGDELDILVVGGGVTGVGCALDAVTRGLRTGLVEQRDFASGTSSRSSKLIHGSSTAACATWRCSTSGSSPRR